MAEISAIEALHQDQGLVLPMISEVISEVTMAAVDHQEVMIAIMVHPLVEGGLPTSTHTWTMDRRQVVEAHRRLSEVAVVVVVVAAEAVEKDEDVTKDHRVYLCLSGMYLQKCLLKN